MTVTKKRNYPKKQPTMFPGRSVFGDLFNSNWPGLGWIDDSELINKWIPAANIKENEEAFLIDLSIPGYTKNDIRIDIDSNRVLHINGEHKEESKEKKDNYTRKEFSYGSFSRSFDLPKTVDEENIVANCNNGVLSLHLPKKETTVMKKNSKSITVS